MLGLAKFLLSSFLCISLRTLANLYALLRWINTTVVVFFAYCVGYEMIVKLYRSSKKKLQNPPQYAKNTTTSRSSIINSELAKSCGHYGR